MLAQAAHLIGQAQATSAGRQRPAAALEECSRITDAIDTARKCLKSSGYPAVLAGSAEPSVHATLRGALGLYTEQLQSSAEMLLGCEYGERVWSQTDEALLALARRMDPLFDAACDLQKRLGAVA